MFHVSWVCGWSVMNIQELHLWGELQMDFSFISQTLLQLSPGFTQCPEIKTKYLWQRCETGETNIRHMRLCPSVCLFTMFFCSVRYSTFHLLVTRPCFSEGAAGEHNSSSSSSCCSSSFLCWSSQSVLRTSSGQDWSHMPCSFVSTTQTVNSGQIENSSGHQEPMNRAAIVEQEQQKCLTQRGMTGFFCSLRSVGGIFWILSSTVPPPSALTSSYHRNRNSTNVSAGPGSVRHHTVTVVVCIQLELWELSRFLIVELTLQQLLIWLCNPNP